jgi:hypothetical protein
MSNLRITDGLYLLCKNTQFHKTTTPIITEIPTDSIICIDCSGSMTHELPKIRDQLKNKVAMMLKETDTITLVWFSGKTQFGVVVENVLLKTAVDLSGVHRAIDNYLKPIGLTGFVEPLDEVERIITRIQKPGRAINLFFMSDGFDNQWSTPQILASTAKLAPIVSSAAIVEFGWYCNRPLMIQMAERLGATEVLAENFPAYEPIFETAITKKITGTKKVDVSLETSPLHGFAFALQDNDVLAFAVDDRVASIPEGISDLYWFSEIPPTANFQSASEVMENQNFTTPMVQALYAGLVPLTQRMLSADIFRVLKVLGDVRLIEQFTQCFGKQAYVDFQTEVVECAFDSTKRYLQGYDRNRVPPDDAYTILDLLDELTNDDKNLFYPNHPAFNYERIGRKTVETSLLNEADEKRIGEIAAELVKTRDPKRIKELQQELSGFTEGKTGLQFVPNNPDAGYPVSSLVLNEDRPNISAHVEIPGTVDLTNVIVESPISSEDLHVFPVKFPTKIHRNYTIIRDGIRNVKVLPVSLTQQTYSNLMKNQIINETWTHDKIFEIDLSKLPLINRKMVKAVSAKDLFTRQYELFMAKAKQKVFNQYADELLPTGHRKGLGDLYGDEAADWLAGLGIKDYGYSPRVELAEATESYYGKELKVALSGLSSLPSVKDVIAKIEAKKKLTTRGTALEAGIREVKGFFESPSYSGINEIARQEMLRVWLTNRKNDTTLECRKLMREIAAIKFSIILGQTWIFASLDENNLSMKFGDIDIECTANLREVEVKI